MNRNAWFVCLLLVAAVVPAGCLKVDAKAPSGWASGWGTPVPPATIPPADPGSKADLLRENQQLRDRAAWLEGRNRKLSKDYKEKEEDADKIRDDMDKIAAERDRYRRAAGR